MKHPIAHWLTGFFMLALLLVGMSASSVAQPAPAVTGTAHWSFPHSQAWAEVNVQERTPSQAEGFVNFQEEDNALGWRRWRARAICVAFGEGFAGEPAAAFVVQLESLSGWTFPGEQVGQYLKLWTSDGGTPATAGDQAGLIVFPPVDAQPPCDYQLPAPSWPLKGGNLMIHP